jgi:DUF4097 and DUF4098 domain-containing protein YvlB
MYKKTPLIFAPLILAAFVVLGVAQQPAPAPSPQVRPAKPAKPADPQTVERAPEARVEPGEQEPAKPIEVKLGRGGKLAIGVGSGRIIVTGWDRDIVHAAASGENGPVQLETQSTGDSSRPRLLLTTAGRRTARDVKVEVKVPRYAELETLEGYRGDIEVSDIDGATLINIGTGDVLIKGVGSLKVSRRRGDVTVSGVKGDLTARSYSGDVVVDHVTGLVDAAATNGNLTISNAGGDVRASSATGDIQVRCGKGRADASSASGSITLIGIGGDVEASTASGEVIFTGQMRAAGNYRMKSISGDVVMTVQSDVPGFTATLTTYNGEIETAFPLKVESPVQGGRPINRRLTGVFGNGQAKVLLDSFSGAVRIAKGTAAVSSQCK